MSGNEPRLALQSGHLRLILMANDEVKKVVKARKDAQVAVKEGQAAVDAGGDAAMPPAVPEADEAEQAAEQEMALKTAVAELQIAVNSFMDSAKSEKHKRLAKDGIRQLLERKEGLFRMKMMGKRVNFAARSVISPDPNIETSEIGIPMMIAENLYYPEVAASHNAQELRALVMRGKVYPGAAEVHIPDSRGGKTVVKLGPTLKMEKREAIAKQLITDIESGKPPMTVFRQLRDGDPLLVNRQPTLHKPGIMAHTAKVLRCEKTIRLHYVNCNTYNADFDGDEMNLHLGQSHEVRSEIKYMMLNPRQVVSPQGNKPVMGIVQDSLLATSKYTKRDTFLEKDLAMQILMWLPVWDGMLPTPCIIKPKELWTGKQIFSKLLPVSLSMTRESAISSKNKKDDPNFAASDCRVVIQNGELLAGIVCKKTIGASSGSLLHLVWLDAGPQVCRDVLSFMQKMVNQWFTYNGFTCGVADIIANDATLLLVEKTLKEAKTEVRKILADAQRGKLETQPGKTMYQSFEAKVNQRLNAAREDAGNIGSSSLDERNNIISMVNAGSKGSPINIAQIIACVGQQNVEGSRIKYGFNDRTLPHFTKDDFGAESRGFVENSYLAGLTPQEVWFHAMGGREGVIDTACKTSETGYIQRRLVKSMETLRVHYDGTSRNAMSDIIQFLYGEDGMDGLWIEDQTLELMTYDNQNLEKTFKHDYRNEDYGVKPWPWLKADTLEAIKSSSELQRKLDDEWAEIKRLKEMICREVFTDGDSKQHMPINVARLLGRAKMQAAVEDKGDAKERYTPGEIIDRVNELMASLEITRGIQEGDTIGQAVEDNAKIILNAHLRGQLGSKKILCKENLTKQSFDWLLGEIKQRFNKSCAYPGETVGVLAAQSVGEPATQMTLNTFHFAGVGAKNVTLGVPRLKELINVAKKVRTPSLAVYLSGDLGKEQERAKDVQSMLEHTTLNSVTSFTQIFWDPDPVNTRVKEDREWVSEYYELPDEDDNPARCGAWLLRIQLSNKVMTDKKLTVREVGERIQNDFLGDLDCIFTDDNAEELVLRIRLLKEVNEMNMEAGAFDPADEKEDRDFKFLRSIESNMLKEMTLAGILGVKKVFMREETIARYNEDKGGFARSKEWVLDTDGVNMEEVMLIPEVDFPRLQSNDIVEILNVMGIEATRKALLIHIRMVISFDGSYVNYRHLGTMCDVMTNRGHMMAITRHGINRTNMGPLMKCSFEETVEILMDAAIYNEVDHMRSVSENIIFGQLCPIGTGVFDIYMDDTRDVPTGSDEVTKCALDDAVPTLPERNMKELFSIGSPVSGGSPSEYLDVDPTPYQDEVHMDFASTGAHMSEMDTPEVTPGQDDDLERAGVGPSPFSPMGDGGGQISSPFSAKGDGSPGYSPALASEMPSPETERGSMTSPSYSPAMPDGGYGASPRYNPASPTYSSARSPAYTPSETPFRASSSTYAGKRSEAPTSPAYAPRGGGGGRSDYSGRTSEAGKRQKAAPTSPAYSPTYSPSAAGQYGAYDPSSAGLTSPLGYEPRGTPQYSPTSVVFPASPAYMPAQTSPLGRGGGSTSPAAAAGSPALGSPVLQDATMSSPGMEELQTSPSYTPHQVPNEPLSGGAQGSVGLTDAQDSAGPMSELFEQSDEEEADVLD